MPSSNLAAYLAKNYLTASTSSSSHPGEPPKKKRKKSKHQSSTGGLIIADDDEDLSLRNSSNNVEERETPMMYEGKSRSADFRKAKENAWKSLASATTNSANDSTTVPDEDNNDDPADTLLRTAQSDEARRLAEQEAENAPTIVNTDDPSMESGVRAGLQTAADTARLVAEEEEAREASRRKSSKKSSKKRRDDNDDQNPDAEGEADQTIYRDATGRRIDISLRRAAIRREAAEKAAAEQQEKRSAMGEVQLREASARRKDLDEAKFLTLGRSVDDEEYNARLKDQVRWDDPMAAYMASKAAEEDAAAGRTGKRGGAGKADVKPRRKEYVGAAPPNRYGIKPGWRWDGVDRGNGFEKEWFQARSRRSRNEKLSYEWQMDE